MIGFVLVVLAKVMFELIVLLIVITILVFALVGFIRFLIWLIGVVSPPTIETQLRGSLHASREASTGITADNPRVPDLLDDLTAARRLLKHLLTNKKISQTNFDRINFFLNQNFGAIDSAELSDDNLQTELELVEVPLAEAVEVETDFSQPAIASLKAENRTQQTVTAGSVPSAATGNLAPWDLPDPLPRAPRRTFGEMMAGFMQEKNMRWGELTSGILIVLSAVGLVVSLQEELSKAIPYFSSILFLLITAAIIGAGIYTLKKWKLRNTSRGTLVIGLCLIPLNFVAACVLSGSEDRRQLNDPWLWAAIVVGVVGFGTLSWFASRFLLRKQNWQLVVAMIGCGGGTILLNRLASESQSSLYVWLLALPIAISFLIGAGTFESRQIKKRYWSARGSNRLLLRLGISAFALLSAISILLIRSDNKFASAICITPVLVLMGLAVSWVGILLRQHCDADRKQKSSLPLIGTALQVLGLLVSGLLLLASLSNPTVLVVNCVIGAIGLGLISWRANRIGLLPIVMSLASVAVLIVLNLVRGQFQFDQWTSPSQWWQAIVAGQSGLCLLACGAMAGLIQSAIANRISKFEVAVQAKRMGWLTAGGIFLFGCGVAVVASLLHRENLFDAITASVLLLAAGLGALVGVAGLRRSNVETVDRQKLVSALSHIGAGLLLMGLAHALWWNPTGQSWFLIVSRNSAATWVWVLALGSVVLKLFAGWSGRGQVASIDTTSTQSSAVANTSVNIVATLQQWATTTALTAVAAVTCLVVARLSGGVINELIANMATDPFVFLQQGQWVFGAITMVAFALLVQWNGPPIVWIGAGWVVLWLVGWSAGAVGFAGSNSMASAVRWLVPIGGLLASGSWLLLNGWWTGPRWLALNQATDDHRSIANQLIDLSLAMVVLVVLLISTVTVSRVMLYGGGSLGGPATGSLFANMDKVVSFGGPLALVVSSFLIYAISQRRPWLATAGSLVFQYMVVLAVVLLFLSPHPKLASAWFVRVLQSMSLGMTLYGFAWWMMRGRIGGATVDHANVQATERMEEAGLMPALPAKKWLNQIETHTLINGLLVTSLAVLVFARFFFVPDQPSDWINSVGSLLGVGAWLLFAALAFTVWREKLWTQRSSMGWLTISGWGGLVLVGMVAAVLDYRLQLSETPIAWLVFQLLACGTVAVSAAQVIGMSRMKLVSRASNVWFEWPIYLTLLIGVVFAVRGGLWHARSLMLFIGLLGASMLLLFTVGGLLRRSRAMFLSALVAMIGATVWVWQSPWSLFAGNQPSVINLSLMLVAGLAIGNLGVHWFGNRTQISSSLRRFSNCVLLLGAVWLLIGSLFQVVCSCNGGFNNTASVLANPLGGGAILLTIALLLLSLWNDGRRFWTAAMVLISLAVGITVAAVLGHDEEPILVGVLFASAMVVALWGVGWFCRASWLQRLQSWGAPNVDRLERQLNFQLPLVGYLLLGLLVLATLIAIVNVEPRGLRYLTAAVPWVLVLGPWSKMWAGEKSLPTEASAMVRLALITLGAVLISWADLPRNAMFADELLTLIVRSLIVLATAMFVYGFLVPRWVRSSDSWLPALRQMAGVTCGLAISCLMLLIVAEYSRFHESSGCGLAIAEAGAVAVAVIGMVIGLISIAVRPQADPFSFSLRGRQVYVYVAQLVVAALVAHLFFALPWLFRFGVKEFWPYIAMLICFGGVGVAQLLEQRKLTVLGQPLFMTAAILPVGIALAIFAIDSRATGEVVMLLVGLAYLMIAYLHRSSLAGIGAIVFGNLALWMFYDNFQNFAFLSHPQLWLIPPAVSVLIAGQLNRQRLSDSQLATLRYLCLAVIYVSSTSEIFISGLGDKLWPPIVLAMLSVAGILLGMLLQIRSFLYLGSLFLLMAMLTMVAHAAKGLDHVWPWWAFGITLGIAILVLFGLFEKKKNQMKEISSRLQEWEN